jgi:hypothetical protein
VAIFTNTPYAQEVHEWQSFVIHPSHGLRLVPDTRWHRGKFIIMLFRTFHENEAVSISVHPVVQFLPRSALVVENVQGVTGDPNFLHTKFSVRNAGQSYVSGYSVGIGVISST